MTKSIPTFIFIFIFIVLSTTCLSCDPGLDDVDISNGGSPTPTVAGTPPEPVETTPVEPDTTVQTAEPLVINIEETVDRTEEPPLHLYQVTVENLTASEDEEVGIHFVYQLIQPTGEATYLLNDPMNPDSGIVTDENGPVIYRIVETVEKRIEDWGDPDQTERVFFVEFPSTVYKVRYWVEVVTRRVSEIEEKELMDVPYITVDEMIMQGGQMITLPE